MIDLINNDVEKVNILINKYKTVLEVSNLRTVDDVQIFVLIIDEAIKYIEDKYNHLNADIKAWCILILKHSIKQIKTDDDVKKNIDDFIKFWNSEYQKYIDDLSMSASEFDRDYGFVQIFIHKKNR